MPEQILMTHRRRALVRTPTLELPTPVEFKPSLEWLINPISKEVFFEQYWEKQPLIIKRSQPNYFATQVSSMMLDLDRVKTKLGLY